MTKNSKSWKITDFYTEEKRKQFYRDLDKTRLAMGHEVCPTTGKEHLQIFITFKRCYTFKSLVKLIGDKCHAEAAKVEDWNYELKEMNYEIHDNRKQGERTDLQETAREVLNGATNREIGEKYPIMMIKYHRGINALRDATERYVEKRDWQMDVRIYWGKSNTGKTRFVWDEFGVDNVYPKTIGKWWDHYKGEKCVLIDDFDPNNNYDIYFEQWLKILDRYPLIVEYKGGSTQFCSKTIIFTSNYNPAGWFREKANRDAFFRRITCISHFKESRTEPEPKLEKGNTLLSPDTSV